QSGPNSSYDGDYIFKNTTGTTWTQTALAAPAHSSDGQGTLAVALDGADTHALAGLPDAQSGTGEAWLWTDSTSWDSGVQLSANDAISHACVGHSIALSADGNTLIAGGLQDSAY